jgi:sterol desaturase/sphingolipid hydroxylase (fatty acid hydroxylase superfamily)
MFESDFVERFSRIHPSTPFIAWVPVIVFVLYRAYARHDLGAASIVALFAAGVLAWTLAEYGLHRYVFHWMHDAPRARRIHFIIHGVHHDFPNDKDRLVMPLAISVPLSVIFYSLFYFTIGRTLGEPFFAGFVLGYLIYDGTHYAVHHFKLTSSIGKWVRKHHLLHHHADHHGGFGVSSPLWDIVFRTMPKHKRATPSR